MNPMLSIPRAFALLAIAVLLAPMQIPEAQASHGAIGVSPATLDFTSPPLLPGGSKVGYLVFQQHHDRPVQVQIEAVSQSGQAEDATSWITLSRQGTVTLAPGTHQIEVRIDVPQTAANGAYGAGVRFQVQPEGGRAFTGSGMTAQTAVTSVVKIAVKNDHEVKQVAVDPDVRIHDAEVEGDLRVSLHITNTGNVDARPRVRLTVLDQYQERQVASHWFNQTLVAPGVADNLTFHVDEHGLTEGQYWGSVSVHLDGTTVHESALHEFAVLEKGALLRHLQLKTIRVDGNITDSTAGKMVKLSPIVVNVGQAAAVATFVGEVWRDGELIDALEVAPVEVAVGQTQEMHILYKPTEPGQYEFKGRVHYGHKVTEEKSVLLRVSEAPADSTTLLYTGVAALLVCGIGATVFRLRPNKR